MKLEIEQDLRSSFDVGTEIPEGFFEFFIATVDDLGSKKVKGEE